MHHRSAQIALALVCFLLGVMLVVQFRSHTRIVRASFTLPVNEQITITSNLYEANQKLHKEVEELRLQLEGYEMAVGTSELDRMVADINRLRIVNGTSEVSGPGIQVTINGALFPEDLQDLVNELRDAGAEAIAVNGRRVVANTSFTRGEGWTVMSGNNQVMPPYVLEAVGHADALDRALIRQGGLIASLQARDPSPRITIFHKPTLVLPKSDQALTIHLASVPD